MLHPYDERKLRNAISDAIEQVVEDAVFEDDTLMYDAEAGVTEIMRLIGETYGTP